MAVLCPVGLVSAAFGHNIQVEEAAVRPEIQVGRPVHALEIFVVVDVKDLIPDKHAADFPQLAAQDIISRGIGLIGRGRLSIL